MTAAIRSTRQPRAPRTPRGRRVTITVEFTASGLAVSAPLAPEFAMMARTPAQLAAAVQAAARSGVGAVDLAGEQRVTRGVGGRRVAAAGRRCDVYDPAAWAAHADGSMTSPSGRRYSAGTQVVRRVLAARAGAAPGGDQQVLPFRMSREQG